MKVQKKIGLKPIDYFKAYLTATSIFIREENRPNELEIEFLSFFMSLPEEITCGDRFNSFCRKKAKEEMNISFSSISNRIKNLIKKGLLDKHNITGKISINENFIPEEDILNETALIVIQLIKQPINENIK